MVLTGPFGAGKTTFVAALALALGSDADVTSPSYTLVHEYPTPDGALVHVDAYRLEVDLDLDATLDLDGYLARARAVVVEWGAGLLDTHPDAWHLELRREGERRQAVWHRPSGGPAPSPVSGAAT